MALAADRISTRRSGAAIDCDPKALIDALYLLKKIVKISSKAIYTLAQQGRKCRNVRD
ncbi:hypothetical protein [Mesorhizobium sp. B2-3-4]|uniref:hypothetical protein n=1 Tax=Mesorhizobium sp. B2-3-4 TaxID=2589959 RepID=UPI0015E3DC58|nr:hypothetical protein [Mesorhizobium sp. B2-3-4]